MDSDFKTLITKLELVKKSEFALRDRRTNPIVHKTRDGLLKKLENIVGRDAHIIYKRLCNEKLTSILDDYSD